LPLDVVEGSPESVSGSVVENDDATAVSLVSPSHIEINGSLAKDVSVGESVRLCGSPYDASDASVESCLEKGLDSYPWR